jgi:UDP-glucose 6-dehydrogenase
VLGGRSSSASARPDGKHFAVWGLAFKPNTDDMREAPSRVLLAAAGARRHGGRVRSGGDGRGARVLALDLTGTGCRVRFADSPMDALTGADALVIVTEWKAFRSPDFEQHQGALKQAVIFDGRNLFEPADGRGGHRIPRHRSFDPDARMNARDMTAPAALARCACWWWAT